jgi:hypothetical protein
MFKNLAVFVAALLCTMPAQGTPVEFRFAATISNNSGIVGVSVGDFVTINLLANNGSSGLNSQSWTIGDLFLPHSALEATRSLMLTGSAPHPWWRLQLMPSATSRNQIFLTRRYPLTTRIHLVWAARFVSFPMISKISLDAQL